MMSTQGQGPDLDEGLDQRALKGLAQMLRLLSEETRLRILFALAGGESDVTGLWGPMGLPQATVSHHLSFLRLAGLVSTRRSGKHIHYRLGPGARLTGERTLSIECPQFALKLEVRQPADAALREATRGESRRTPADGGGMSV